MYEASSQWTNLTFKHFGSTDRPKSLMTTHFEGFKGFELQIQIMFGPEIGKYNVVSLI